MELITTCREIKEHLSEYLDGELDRAVGAEIERHLSECENCRVLVDTLNKTILLCRDYGPTSVPAGAHARLIRILDLRKCAPSPHLTILRVAVAIGHPDDAPSG